MKMKNDKNSQFLDKSDPGSQHIQIDHIAVFSSDLSTLDKHYKFV
jgi:hypothetical protein